MTDTLITGNLTIEGTANFSLQVTPKYASLADVKATGVDGGTSAAGAPNNNRTLNTVVNPSLVTLNANNIDFKFNELGTYFIKASAPAFNVQEFKTFLATSAGTKIAYGTLGYNRQQLGVDLGNTRSTLMYLLTVTDTNDEYRILQYTQLSIATNGLGVASNSGNDEVYTKVDIMKISD